MTHITMFLMLWNLWMDLLSSDVQNMARNAISAHTQARRHEAQTTKPKLPKPTRFHSSSSLCTLYRT